MHSLFLFSTKVLLCFFSVENILFIELLLFCQNDQEVCKKRSGTFGDSASLLCIGRYETNVLARCRSCTLLTYVAQVV